MPKLNAVIESALYVDDLARAQGFYEGSLGLPLLFGNQRMCAFDIGGRSVLLLFLRGGSNEDMKTSGGMIPGHDGQGPLHIGFAVAADELAAWEKRLMERGIAIESRVSWPRGGPASISGIRTDTFSNWQRPGSGPRIDSRRPGHTELR